MNYADNLPKEDSFLKEEVAAFIHLVLKNPVDWAVQFGALNLRCQWEQVGTTSRKLDRCLRQLDVRLVIHFFTLVEMFLVIVPNFRGCLQICSQTTSRFNS